MKTRPPWVNVVLAAIYLCVFACAVGFMHLMEGETAFCGLYALMVTFPLSIILLWLLNAMHPPGTMMGAYIAI